MSAHIFESEVAVQVGVNAAIIFQNIVFWCERNEANNENMHEGRAWTYNSVTAFSKLFPYLTTDQIRRALERLVAEGYLGVGNFNEDARDRTKWYCVLRQRHSAPVPETFGTSAEPLPDSKPDNKPDINKSAPNGADGLFKAEDAPEKIAGEVAFEDFWKAYPKKAGKPAAKKAFLNQVKAGHDPKAIISGAKRYAAWLASGGPKDFRPIPKFPQGWLNDHRWNDEDLPPEAPVQRRRLLGPQFGEVVR